MKSWSGTAFVVPHSQSQVLAWNRVASSGRILPSDTNGDKNVRKSIMPVFHGYPGTLASNRRKIIRTLSAQAEEMEDRPSFLIIIFHRPISFTVFFPRVCGQWYALFAREDSTTAFCISAIILCLLILPCSNLWGYLSHFEDKWFLVDFSWLHQ